MPRPLTRFALLGLALLTLPSCQTWVSGTDLPAPTYVKHPPQYIPPSPAFPLQRELAQQEATTTLRPTVPVPVVPSPAPAPVAPPVVPPPVPAPVGYPGTTPPVPVPGPLPPPVPPPPLTLEVANVHKEPVLLFTVRDGELTFCHKLPPGEAVDLPTSPGARWVGVFSQAPYRAHFTPTQTSRTWLLRPAPTPAGALPALPSAATSSGLPADAWRYGMFR